MKKKGWIATLILTVLLFAVLLFVQRIVFTGGPTKNVIVAKTDVSEETEITEENIRDYFTIQTVDAGIVPEGALTKKEELVGTSLSRFLPEKSVVSKEDVTTAKKQASDFETPLRTSFQLSSIAAGLAGKLREGQVISIFFTDKKSEEIIEVEKKALVEKVYTAEGAGVANSDTEGSAIIVQVVIDKANLEKMNRAIDAGTIKISQEVEKGSGYVE